MNKERKQLESRSPWQQEKQVEQYCILLAASKRNSSSGISTVGTLSSASNVEQRKKGDKGAQRERDRERV